MIGVLIILSLTSAALSKKYYLDNKVPIYLSKIPSNQENIFYTKGMSGQSFNFTLTMKKMNETPFNLLYFDTWRDNYYNPIFGSDIDVKSNTTTDIITIKYNGTIDDSGTNYIGFKFTPDYDLENVKAIITISDGSDKEAEEAAEALFILIIFAAIISYIVPVIIIIIIVVVIIVIVIQCTRPRRPPPQFNNNNPNQQKNLPQQPQYYSPPQPQYYPPPQPQMIVQPQDPPIQASTQ